MRRAEIVITESMKKEITESDAFLKISRNADRSYLLIKIYRVNVPNCIHRELIICGHYCVGHIIRILSCIFALFNARETYTIFLFGLEMLLIV